MRVAVSACGSTSPFRVWVLGLCCWCWWPSSTTASCWCAPSRGLERRHRSEYHQFHVVLLLVYSSLSSPSLLSMRELENAFTLDVLAATSINCPGSSPYLPPSYPGGSGDEARPWPHSRPMPSLPVPHQRGFRQHSLSRSEVSRSILSLITLRDIFVDRKRIQFGCKIMEGEKKTTCTCTCTVYVLYVQMCYLYHGSQRCSGFVPRVQLRWQVHINIMNNYAFVLFRYFCAV